MSTLTGLVGGGGGGIPFTDINTTTLSLNSGAPNFEATTTLLHGSRSAGTYTLLSITGSGYLWWLYFNGSTGNAFREVQPRIIVDGNAIITQNSTPPFNFVDVMIAHGGEVQGGNSYSGARPNAAPPIAFKNSFTYQIVVTGSLDAGDGTYSQLGYYAST